ncbi:endolytic transglycosylase MltG [Candidatus Microgenomates bacterium]|nr:endolytic transglycosylase MltG [Candidatus Microgenomates bacterium]
MNKSKTFSKFLLLFLLLIIVGGVFLKLNYDSSLKKPNSNNSEKILFEIKSGESVDNILSDLIDKGLLKESYKYYTKIYLKLNNLGPKLQAGIYELPLNLNIIEIVQTLQNGKNQDVWVTIPEGLRKDEIAEILEEELKESNNSKFSKEAFLNLTTDSTYISTLGLVEGISDLEGFLFPDKYAFPVDSTAEAVIAKMIINFKSRIGEYTYQDIVIASIVEREGFNSTDRPIIAGIIIKRFNEGWLLQTDATLLYPVKDWKHTITAEDKNDDNPYNTYKKIGLPPTPICNPGSESIKAVQNYTESEYYYYIHDNDGNPHYARNLEEHNSNVLKYLR